MSYKKYLEDSLGIKINEKEYTKRRYLNFLNSLGHHTDVLMPNDEVFKNFEEDNSGAIMEYAISMCGGDSSDIDMDEINIFVKRLNNGYNLINILKK